MTHQETKYVDGFVLIIPKAKVDEYRKIATEAGKIWKKYGALAYRECMLEDPQPQYVTLTFPILTKAGPDDTVWFSYIEYKSKAHRDEVNAKVMQDPYMQSNPQMPFDMDRLSFGGFEVIVEAE